MTSSSTSVDKTSNISVDKTSNNSIQVSQMTSDATQQTCSYNKVIINTLLLHTLQNIVNKLILK